MLTALNALGNLSDTASKRCAAIATKSAGAGNPLLRSFNLCRFISKLEDKDRTRLSSIDDNQPIRSALTGTAYSAAAVGVGARKSEAKSINVVSVS